MKIHNRTPDIENLYAVLRGGVPARPTLFELFLNQPLYERLAGYKSPGDDNESEYLKFLIDAFTAAGYDYTTVYASSMTFPAAIQEQKKTISLNEGFVITDEASFSAYKWPEPENFDYSRLKAAKDYLPDGMKLMVMGPGGVLENTIKLVGYENLCYMLYDEPQLLGEIFDNVGERLLKYYTIAAEYDSVGIIASNDDWGFKTQTFLSIRDMEKYVFPWHKKIVDAAHAQGKLTIIHTCGYMNDTMDHIIEIGFDGKHSFEDNILPVEAAYDKWGGRIAILGGIDVDFIIRCPIESIISRCRLMLEKSSKTGGYALGTGNSVPEYIPQENYFAMIKTALD